MVIIWTQVHCEVRIQLIYRTCIRTLYCVCVCTYIIAMVSMHMLYMSRSSVLHNPLLNQYFLLVWVLVYVHVVCMENGMVNVCTCGMHGEWHGECYAHVACMKNVLTCGMVNVRTCGMEACMENVCTHM